MRKVTLKLFNQVGIRICRAINIREGLRYFPIDNRALLGANMNLVFKHVFYKVTQHLTQAWGWHDGWGQRNVDQSSQSFRREG